MFFKKIRSLVVFGFSFLLTTGLFAQNLPAANAGKVGAASTASVVKGVVQDAATGKAVNGARLYVPGFSAVVTDSLGHYTLKVPAATASIFVEAEGYDAALVPVKYREQLTIHLQSNTVYSFNDQLETPTGTKYRRNLTASADVQRVTGWQQPWETVDAWLQGRVAGLNVIRRSGMQGVGANLFLNGINSLYATNKPLIVIDGMPYDANEYGESLIANTASNSFNLIDIKDIDNLTVIRDAASLYGAKGSNGAILINTVSAQGQQATKIDAGIYSGFHFAPNNLPVMNAGDYRMHLSRMLSSKGLSANEIASLPYMIDNPAREDYQRYHNSTNWQRKVLANSMDQNVYLRITGGDNIATYGLTVGFMNNKGIVKNTGLERYNTRFNAAFTFTEKLKGTANLSFTYNKQDLKDQGIAEKTAPLYNALVKAPFLHDHELSASGVVSPNLEGIDSLGIGNPSAMIETMEAYNKYYRFFGSFRFSYDINRYLAASTLLGLQYDKYRESFFVPSKGIVKDTLWNDIADNRMGSQVRQLFSFFNDTRLEYKRRFNYIHALEARVGFRFQDNKANQVNVITANSATDDLVSVQNGLASLRQVGGEMGEWAWINSYLGADYGFKDKLLVNLSMAVDGSSRFGLNAAKGLSLGGRKFPLFSSLGAAWLISSEQFMRNSAIDLLKLRATYSMAGNDDIGNYTARQLYVGQNLLGVQGSVRNGIANPALQWETISKINAGVDFAFWKERVSLAVDVFRSRTTNMLVHLPLPSITGNVTVLTNDGSMKNKGVEASLNIRALNKRKFKWDVGLNLATYENEILSVPGGAAYTDFAGATILTAAGRSASQFYGYATDGVFTSEADATSAGLSKLNANGSLTPFRAGDVKFVDRNGDKVIDENDRTVIGDPNADIFGGFSNRILWQGFELNALVTFSVGNDVYNYLRSRLESQAGVENQLQTVLNSWRVDGQHTNMPKATWGDPMGNSRFSDRWIEDGSYLRLRSLSLTYNVPLKPAAPFRSIAVSVIGNNLFTATHYLGYDPEFSPSLSPLAQGIDTGLDPLFKSVVVGVRIGL